MLETVLRPRPPYVLARCAGGESDATRRFRDGLLRMAFRAAGQPALAHVWQRGDGALEVRLDAPDPATALDALRFLLAVDEDPAPFLRAVRSDRLLGDLTRRRWGYRPLRVATVTHALLRALAGQLIQASEARRIENRLIRRVAAPLGDLWLPPAREELGALAAWEIEAAGLAGRRAAALVGILRRLDVERLRGLPLGAVAARLARERQVGPWSVGVVSLYGLGSWERGLVGDLGLVRLCSGLLGRRATVEETAELLQPYGEWAGLASAYLLGHPLARVRRPLGPMVDGC